MVLLKLKIFRRIGVGVVLVSACALSISIIFSGSLILNIPPVDNTRALKILSKEKT